MKAMGVQIRLAVPFHLNPFHLNNGLVTISVGISIHSISVNNRPLALKLRISEVDW